MKIRKITITGKEVSKNGNVYSIQYYQHKISNHMHIRGTHTHRLYLTKYYIILNINR